MHCSKCGYELSFLTSAACPECGTSVDSSLLRQPSLSRRARFTSALVLVLLYTVATGLLAFVDSAILGHFDPKFGPSQWLGTWPLYALFFTPALLLAAAMLIVLGTTVRRSIALLSILLCMLLASVESCLLTDPDWGLIWLQLALGSVMVGLWIGVRGLTNRSSCRAARRALGAATARRSG